MANVHRVLIKGRLPYDIVNKLNDSGLSMFARFASPCWGFRIEYGEISYKPVPETGGKYAFYDFTISGEEAVWESGIVKFCKELKEAGVEITKAEVMDMECSYMPIGGSILDRI